jgi:signal peptidase I
VRRFIAKTTTAVLLGTAIVFGWASLTHRVSYVVTHGVSMQPLYHAGDLIVVTRKSSYQIGDIVAYRYSSIVVLHRIVSGNAAGFTTKGDNNKSLDLGHPSSSQIIGRAVLHIPSGGLWLRRAISPTGLGVIAFCLLTAAGGAAQRRRRRGRHRRAARANQSYRAGMPNMPATVSPDTASRSRMSSAMMSPAMRQATAAGIAALALAGAALGAAAWTRSPMQTVAVPPPAAPTMTFSYAATVPRSPAYDGTTVGPPDPVFRRVVNDLAVTFAYQGPPGSVRVEADLSTALKWRATVPLTPTRPITGGRYRGVVHLNLDALQARANAGSAATGLPAGEVTVAVVPRVTTRTGARFAPALTIKLTPLLAVVGEPLVVSGTQAAATTTRVARELSLFGHPLMRVATARLLSASLLLDAILDAIAFVLLLRRFRPDGEADRIRRRHGKLLLQVQPVAPPGDLPVIRVTQFRTLVRLAERYQQLILFWANPAPGSTTFAVFDDAATYWYCTDPAAVAPAAEPASWPVPVAEVEPAAPQWLDPTGGYDPLTSLASRRMLQEEIQQMLDGHGGDRSCLMLIDLDQFARVNQVYGRPAGDALLIAVAERLRRTVRPRDLVARLGDDDFAVMLEDVPRTNVTGLAHRILRTVQEQLIINGTPVTVSATVGVAEARPADSAEDLMQRAASALATAKDSNSEHFAWYADTPASRE